MYTFVYIKIIYFLDKNKRKKKREKKKKEKKKKNDWKLNARSRKLLRILLAFLFLKSKRLNQQRKRL